MLTIFYIRFVKTQPRSWERIWVKTNPVENAYKEIPTEQLTARLK